MKTNLLQVNFYKVNNNASKIKLISERCMESFNLKNRLLIAVANLQSANYLDQLLWRTPVESFLPHTVTDMPSLEWIVITLQNQSNVNQSKQLLNLCNYIPDVYKEMEIIYELLDYTSPEKLNDSNQKLKMYESRGVNIKIIE